MTANGRLLGGGKLPTQRGWVRMKLRQKRFERYRQDEREKIIAARRYAMPKPELFDPAQYDAARDR